VAAVDTPPGLGLGAAARGVFPARPGPRRLAEAAARYVAVAGALAIVLAARRPDAPAAATWVVGALTCAALAAVGLAVRRAHVGIDADGVRWGWGGWVVRMDRDRIDRVLIFRDGLAVRARRGTTWFLAARDWDRFEVMRRTVADVGLPAEEHDRRAPLRARVQSYGRFLDGLVIAAMVGATLVAAGAAL